MQTVGGHNLDLDHFVKSFCLNSHYNTMLTQSGLISSIPQKVFDGKPPWQSAGGLITLTPKTTVATVVDINLRQKRVLIGDE